MQDIHEHDGIGTTRRGLLRGMVVAGTAAEASMIGPSTTGSD